MEPIKYGKYTFQITDIVQVYAYKIYGRQINLFAIDDDICGIDLFVTCNSDEFPVYAFIRRFYRLDGVDSEYCSAMIHALLKYVHNKIPTLTEVCFDDTFGIEINGRHPNPLYSFSIAFNGKTWFEKYFNARHTNMDIHCKYKNAANVLLNVKETKSEITFFRFLEIVAPPMELLEELSIYYDISETFDEFFQIIPLEDKVRLTCSWIDTFMKWGLRGAFDKRGWIIELPVRMNESNVGYYIPRGNVIIGEMYADVGVDAGDV